MDAPGSCAVLLVRHAESLRRRDPRGRVEELLTERGEGQARTLAQWFGSDADAVARGVVVFTSPWPRAMLTGRAIAAALRVPLHVEEDLAPLRLRVDADLGTDELARLREQALREAAVPPAPGCESFAMLRARLDALVDGLQAACAPRLVVCITHRDVLQAIEPRATLRAAQPFAHAGWLGIARAGQDG